MLGTYHTSRGTRIAVELLSTGKFDGLSLCTEIRPLEASGWPWRTWPASAASTSYDP